MAQQCIKPSKVKARPRRTTAELQVPVPNNILVRRLVAAISAHDFNQNHAILRSRAIGASVDYAPAIKRKGPMERWYSIREERRDALRVVAQALVIHADYSYDSEYLFEVKPRLSEAIEKQGQAAKPWLSVVITKLGAAAKQRLSVVITKLGAITK